MGPFEVAGWVFVGVIGATAFLVASHYWGLFVERQATRFWEYLEKRKVKQ